VALVGITRLELLRGALAMLASSAAPLSAEVRLRRPVPKPGVDSGPSILDLEFEPVSRFRPFNLLPSHLVTVHERFQVEPLRGPAPPSDHDPAEVTPQANGLGFAPSQDSPKLLALSAGLVAPYGTVIASIGSGQGHRAEGPTAIAVGLMRDPRNHVVAVFERHEHPAGDRVSIEVLKEGARTRIASIARNLEDATRCAFVLNENHVIGLVAGADGWIPIVWHRVTDLLDFRDPAVLRRYRFAVGPGGSARATTFSEVQAGYFGQAGLRDLHIVSSSDGRPYIRDRKLYFTATQAGLSFFEAAHWGVWTLDLDQLDHVEQVATLFFARDGLVLGDHAGQIVADERHGGFHVLVSSWGDFAFKGVHVRYCRTFDNVLSGVHVLTSARLFLPTRLSTWDPAITRIGERWYVAFVESEKQDPARGFEFRPALAHSHRGGWLNRLTRIGTDRSARQTEGTILQRVGEQWHLLASDGAERRYPVYDLSMSVLGFLKAPYGTNIPHPQVVPVLENGRTRYLLLTFDGRQYHPEVLGYGTHGDVIVMQARQMGNGGEFANP
jgi:hypothetical protein